MKTTASQFSVSVNSSRKYVLEYFLKIFFQNFIKGSIRNFLSSKPIMANQDKATLKQFCEETQKTLERFNVFCALNNIEYKDLDTLYPVLGTKSSFHELTQEDYLRISPQYGQFLYENRQKFLKESKLERCLEEKLNDLSLLDLNNLEKSGSEVVHPKGESQKQKSGKPLFIHDFLKNLLVNKEHTDLITWEDQSVGKFKIVNPEGLADLWRLRERNETEEYNKKGMDWGKCSRAMRYHYETGRLKSNTERLVYEFAGETLKELYYAGICTGVDIKKLDQEIADFEKERQKKLKEKKRQKEKKKKKLMLTE